MVGSSQAAKVRDRHVCVDGQEQPMLGGMDRSGLKSTPVWALCELPAVSHRSGIHLSHSFLRFLYPVIVAWMPAIIRHKARDARHDRYD